MKRRGLGGRAAALLAALALAFSAAAAFPVSVRAAGGLPDDLICVWDMEKLPENLFDAGLALSQEDSNAGHSLGYTDAVRAEGKGADGSAAAGLLFTKECTGSSLYGDGWNLLLKEEAGALTDWYGVTEYWFYADVSEFRTAPLYLDLMIDGVHPEIGAACCLVSGGKRTEAYCEASYNGAAYGRILLPEGFRGWIGLPVEGFKSTFGTVGSLGFQIEPRSDVDRFPLSMYIDEISIVRRDTANDPLRVQGELFNKGTPAGAVVAVDVTKHYQTVRDYGASSAWWANYMGTAPFVDEALRLLFTDEGAGLNGYRHNIGGSVKTDGSDAGTPWGGRGPLSPLTEEGTYDENRDAEAIAVLEKIKKLGTVDMMVMFMNSPPSTMTNNGMTNGDPFGDTVSNLREDCYEAYASYVVDMVQLYNYLGYPFDYVSPINEPQWEWTSGSQEGCHYTAEEAIRLDLLVIEELNRRKAEDPTIKTKISVSETANWYDKSYLNYYVMKAMGTPLLAQNIDHLSAHSYGSSADVKRRLVRDMQNFKEELRFPFKQTEYGPSVAQPDFSIQSALDVARVMYEDLSILNVDSWTYWRAVANGNYTDGLIYANKASSALLPSRRLWAMGQYARFTKGATRIGVNEENLPKGVFATAFARPQDNQIVVVMVSENSEDQAVSFAGLRAGSTGQVWETSALRQLENRGTMTADSGYVLPARSITTFVFDAQGLDQSSFEKEDEEPAETGPAESTAPAGSTEAPETTEAAPVPVTPPQTSSRGLWTAVMILGCLLVAGSAAGLFLVYRKKAPADGAEK